MKKNVYLLVVLTFMLVGCRWHEEGYHGDSPIFIDPQMEQQKSLTKAGETSFSEGDELGLYVVQSGRDLEIAGNAVDNALFKVSGGKLGGSPPVYYPNLKELVDLYSYYPYQPGLANAREVFFGIHTDQADFSLYRTSDLCCGVRLDVAPTASAAPIIYSHKLSRVIFKVVSPLSIGGKTVASIEGVTLLHILDSVVLNLISEGILSKDHRSNVSMYHQAEKVFSAIVPPQLFEVGALARIRLKYDDASTSDHILNLASDQQVVGGASNNFEATINDNGTVVLDSSPTISSWQGSDTTGVVTSPIENSFNALWLLPNPKYNTATSVVLSIYDGKSNLTRNFMTTNFELLADRSSSKLAVFKFDLSLPVLSGVSYPYVIGGVSFLNSAGDTIQRCDALVAANVTRSGSYTLGLEQTNMLHIVDGSVLEWDEVSGVGGIGGGVANTFKIQFIEPQFDFLTLLGGVRLRIDGVDYNFSPVSSVGNILLQNTSRFSFPDVNGKVPPIFPYVIEQIVMKRADGSEIQALDANIQVTRGGDITLQVFRGVVVKTTTTVQGYGSAVESGDVEYRGPVLTNKIGVVYCSGGAVASTSCLNVKKIRLTIDGSISILLGDYTMSGTQFSASSNSPIDIKTSASAPANYPYSITKVELIDQSGATLEDVTLAEPIKVLCGGEVAIRLMK